VHTVEEQTHYIITPFIQRNMNNLIRAASTRKYPVLIQGPTSSGKTSMIEYLAKRSGNKFVRINNHEHTDLQEYLGSYISGADGKLTFQEGILVQALREGHWIVLDELNLAPTDVLEALNRLLDDNRELLIPETQEVVRPHEDFMLFATQNPAGSIACLPQSFPGVAFRRHSGRGVD
jgi:midasin